MAILDLAKTEFTKASFWNGLLRADELHYQGHLLDKVQFFKAVIQGEPCGYAVAHIVRRDEDFIWEAARDIIDRAVKQAALSVRGIYSFELLAFEAHQELKTFNYNELAQVLVNTSRILKPGEITVIKYSSVYGLFLKLVDESWGKISCKTSVELVADKPRLIVDQFSRLLKATDSFSYPMTLLINDLSTKSSIDLETSDEQKLLWDQFKAKRAKVPLGSSRGLFLRDSSGLKEIL